MQNMQSRTDTVGTENYLPAVVMSFGCPDIRCDEGTHNMRVSETRKGVRELREATLALTMDGVTDFTFWRLTEDGYTDITAEFLMAALKSELRHFVRNNVRWIL